MVRAALVLVHLIGLVYTDTDTMPPPSSATPPMGWISWNKFGCQRDCFSAPDTCIGKRLVRRTADAMINLGLRDLGYRYVILDGCWEAGPRDPISLEYIVSETQFPQGVKSVSRYLRDRKMSLGLLFTETCDGQSYMEADARMAIRFELDFVKSYGCAPERFPVLNRELRRSAQKPLLACSGTKIQHIFTYEPSKLDWPSLIRYCDTWRIIPNNSVDWSGMITALSTWRRSMEIFRSLSGPSHWADLGTLGIGNLKLSPEQQRSQMAMWCLLASPLIISADFSSIEPFSLELLKNSRLIDINQDPNGRPAKFIKVEGGVQYWTRELFDQRNTWAIAFLNENWVKVKINVRLIDMGIRGADTTAYQYTLTDVFNGTKTKTVEPWQTVPLEINGYDTLMYTVQFVVTKKPKLKKKKVFAV